MKRMNKTIKERGVPIAQYKDKKLKDIICDMKKFGIKKRVKIR